MSVFHSFLGSKPSIRMREADAALQDRGAHCRGHRQPAADEQEIGDLRETHQALSRERPELTIPSRRSGCESASLRLPAGGRRSDAGLEVDLDG